MSSPIKRVQESPLLIRTVPFFVFLLLTFGQGKFFENSQYWLYLGKIGVGVALIWMMRPCVAEMRWKLSWEAIVVGVAVFVIWVGLDPFYPKFGSPGEAAWKPFDSFSENRSLAWFVVMGRIAGATLVVPPLEEVFYRSMLYRYIIAKEFTDLPLNTFRSGAFLLSAAIFGLAHYEWLAGLLCAFAYHGLILRHNRLGDAMTAHATTNLLLGLWVVWKEQWHFW